MQMASLRRWGFSKADCAAAEKLLQLQEVQVQRALMECECVCKISNAGLVTSPPQRPRKLSRVEDPGVPVPRPGKLDTR